MFKKSFSDFLFSSTETTQMFMAQVVLMIGIFYGSYILAKYFVPVISAQLDLHKDKKFLIIGILLSGILGISQAVITWVSYKVQTYSDNSYSYSMSPLFGIVEFSVYAILLYFFLKMQFSSIENDSANSKFKFLGIFFSMLAFGTYIGLKLLIMLLIKLVM